MGTQEWSSIQYAFYRCSNLVINAVDIPNLSSVTSTRGMFWYASSFNQDISSWNVRSVTTMRNMFHNADSFNQDLSSWIVDQVTDCEDFSSNSDWTLPKPNFSSCTP